MASQRSFPKSSRPLWLGFGLLLAGCSPLLMGTEGGPEIRHRYHAVYSDAGDRIAVLEETYTWDCSGTLGRCYDNEYDFRHAVYLVDTGKTSRRDTVLREIPGRAPNPELLYLSTRKDRILFVTLDTLFDAPRLVVADLRGNRRFEVYGLERFRQEYLRAVVPSPAFDRLSALITNQPGFGESRPRFSIFHLSLDDGSILDSTVFHASASDTVSPYAKALIWESDADLLVHTHGWPGDPGLIAYRIRDGKVIDTLAEAGCIGRKTSSSPYGPDGKRMYWFPEGPKQGDHWTDGCRGYRE